MSCQPARRIGFVRSRAAQPPLRGFTLELTNPMRLSPGKTHKDDCGWYANVFSLMGKVPRIKCRA